MIEAEFRLFIISKLMYKVKLGINRVSQAHLKVKCSIHDLSYEI